MLIRTHAHVLCQTCTRDLQAEKMIEALTSGVFVFVVASLRRE